MMKKLTLLCLSVWIMTLSACSETPNNEENTPQQDTPTDPDPDTPSDPTQPDDQVSKTEPVQIVFWNDFHSALYEEKDSSNEGKMTGGLPVFMGAIKAVKGDGLSLLLDGGDMFEGAPVLNNMKGLGMIEIMNTLGIDATTIGNHEFDYGESASSPQGALLDAIDKSHFSWVCSNIMDENSNASWLPDTIKPYTIIQKGPYRIAVTGLATLETPMTTTSSHVSGLRFDDPAEKLQQIIPQIEAENPDFTIVLAHLSGVPQKSLTFNQLYTDVDFDEEMADIFALPEDILGKIDLIAAGHEHKSFIVSQGGTIAVENIPKGKELTTMTLKPDESGKLHIDTNSIVKYRLSHDAIYGGCENGYDSVPDFVTVSGNLSVHPDDDAIRLTSEFEAASGVSCGSVACSTDELYRNYDGESGLGNLFCDAQKSQFPEAEIAVLNVGALRAALPKGDITESNIEAVMPFNNTGNLVLLTGRQIVQMLQVSSTLHKGALQVSGITYEYEEKCGRTPSDLNGDGKTESWEINCLCDSVQVNGASLALDKSYKVAMSDYILNGGDGLGGIIDVDKDVLEKGDLILPYIINYIQNLMPAGTCFGNSTLKNVDSPRVRKTKCSSFLD